MARIFTDSELVHLPEPIQLENAPKLWAVVRLSSGTAVDGALVHQFLKSRAFAPVADADLEGRGQRLLHIAHRTDPEGRVLLLSLPGTQVVYAEMDGLQSELVLCQQPAELELRLVSTFRAYGDVDPWKPGAFAGVVHCTAVTADIGKTYASISVGADGRWGPAQLPRVDADYWSFRLVPEGSVPVERFLDSPLPGRDIRVDFKLEDGDPLVVHVRDADGNAIAGVEVDANWTREDKWFRTTTFSDALGVAGFGACPDEMLWLRAMRDGYVTQVLPPFEFHSDYPQPVEMVLERAARLTVRCTSGGEPLRDYDLFYWRESQDDYEIETVIGSPEGKCMLSNVPSGQVSLFAYGRTTAQSELVVVHVSAEESNEVEINVPNGMYGSGRVIDARTGEAITGAELKVPARANGVLMNQRGPTIHTDSDGVFSASHFGPGENVIQVSADGYAETTTRAFGVPGADLDFGSIGLERLQALEVALDPEIEFDMTLCRAELRGRQYRPRQAFDEKGRTTFEGLGPGLYDLKVIRADGLHINIALDLVAGREWTVHVPVPSLRTVHVEVLPGPDGVLPTGLNVQIDARRPDGSPLTELTGIVDSGIADVPTSAVGLTVFTVIGSDGVLGYETAELSEDGGDSVRIEVGASRRTIRVVDAHGDPIPGTLVVIRHPSEVPAWALSDTTGPGGEVRFPIASEGTWAVDLVHSTRGSALEIPVRFVDDVTELVLEADATVAVGVLDGSQPLVGVQLSIGGKRLDGRILGWVHTDEQGRGRLAGVAPGTYRVGVAQAGIWPTERIVEAREPEQLVPIQARRIGSVAIAVRRQGAALAGARLELVDDASGERVADWVATGRAQASSAELVTDAKGRLRVEGVPHGSYRWSLDLGPDGWRSGELDVPPAAVGEVRLEVP